MRKKTRRISIISGLVIVLIALLNYTPAKWVLEFGREYHYSTASGKVRFWEMPSKGHYYANVLEGHQNYRSQSPNASDTILYRNFRRNPLLIWQWHDYLFHPRYRLPYAEAKPEILSTEHTE